MDELIDKLKGEIIHQLNLEDLKKEDIDNDAPLFGEGLGLDSIDALELIVLLEKNYSKLKRPGDYAQKLNISAPYLNECIKNATGHSVSQHIQDRIILEAKRLLYHSDKSVKEIATELGFDDLSQWIYPVWDKRRVAQRNLRK